LLKPRVNRLQTRRQTIDHILQVERQRLNAIAQPMQLAVARARMDQRGLHLVQRRSRPIESLVVLLDHDARGLVASGGEGEQRKNQEGEKAERRDAQGAGIRLEGNLGGLSDKSGERKARIVG
jgi:hypothetical protein